MTLAVTYRPTNFEDLCEQKSIVSILEYQINTGCPKNAYLFVGPAGCGKTTSARILASKLNDGKGTAIEKDAARNNGVDEIREIIKDASFRSIDSKYKIFIIDECHMITTQGWNAFLKMLEEPPKTTIFIMCTTDPQKIPATILSRVQRFDFQRISHAGIVDRLKYIVEQENDKTNKYNVDGKAFDVIARMANGGMRDAISLLEKCLDYSKDLDVEKVVEALGWVQYDALHEMFTALMEKDATPIINIIEDCYIQGHDLKNLSKQLTKYVLDTTILYCTNNEKLVDIPEELCDELVKRQEHYNKKAILTLLHDLLELDNKIKFHANPKLLLEGTLVALCR